MEKNDRRENRGVFGQARILMLRLWDADREVIGDETRRSGRFLLTGSTALALVATGLIQLDSLPGLAVVQQKQGFGIDSILAAFLIGGFFLYLLYLGGDIQRSLSADCEDRKRRIMTDLDVQLRDLEESSRVRRYEATNLQHQDETAREVTEPIQAKLASIESELFRISAAGETGSRFTPHAAERAITEANLKEALSELEKLESNLKKSGLEHETSELPRRIAIAIDFAHELDSLRSYKASISSSPVLIYAARVRVAVEIFMAPVLALIAVAFWWLA